MARTVPTHDAKIGKKIDYLAAQLGDALQGHQFVRKARRLWRKTGEGQQQCYHVLDLQGDKWNEGSLGKFCVNIGVQFPELKRLYAALSGQAWLGNLADEPDTASCYPSARLDTALPAKRESWWAAEMDAGHDIWFEIKANTDLAALAGVLCRAAHDYLLPWFESNGSFEAIFAGQGRAMQHHGYRLICGTLAGHKDQVRALFLENGAQWFRAEMFEKTQDWLRQNGVAFDAVKYVPEPPSPRDASRIAAFEAAQTRAQATELRLAQDARPASERLPVLIEAYHDACRTRDSEHASSPIWALLQGADVDTRKQAVLTIMQQLVNAPTDVPSLRPNIWGSFPSYDGYWGDLLKMLLKGLPCDEGFARALFSHLPALTGRFTRPGYICLEFTDTFGHVVRYLCHEARPWSETFKPDVIHLLALVRDVAIADFDALGDPLLPDASNEALRHRLADYPEQQFEKPDREAVAALRKWLNRDAQGRDVLRIEHDDWGRQLADAMKVFPGDITDLTAMFAWFAASPPAKVTPAFVKQVQEYIAALGTEPNIQKVIAWLDGVLRSYANSDLQHEWATTVPRPGVGAIAGETSGNILLGLCRLSGAWQPERLAQALVVVAQAAFAVIPEVQIRNQKAASAALEALAASARGQALLLEMRAGTKKPAILKAVDAALAKAAA